MTQWLLGGCFYLSLICCFISIISCASTRIAYIFGTGAFILAFPCLLYVRRAFAAYAVIFVMINSVVRTTFYLPQLPQQADQMKTMQSQQIVLINDEISLQDAETVLDHQLSNLTDIQEEIVSEQKAKIGIAAYNKQMGEVKAEEQRTQNILNRVYTAEDTLDQQLHYNYDELVRNSLKLPDGSIVDSNQSTISDNAQQMKDTTSLMATYTAQIRTNNNVLDPDWRVDYTPDIFINQCPSGYPCMPPTLSQSLASGWQNIMDWSNRSIWLFWLEFIVLSGLLFVILPRQSRSYRTLFFSDLSRKSASKTVNYLKAIELETFDNRYHLKIGVWWQFLPFFRKKASEQILVFHIEGDAQIIDVKTECTPEPDSIEIKDNLITLQFAKKLPMIKTNSRYPLLLRITLDRPASMRLVSSTLNIERVLEVRNGNVQYNNLSLRQFGALPPVFNALFLGLGTSEYFFYKAFDYGMAFGSLGFSLV